MEQEKLMRAFNDVIWMAIRYANGRPTPAPSIVRDAIKLVQSIYPDWKPMNDRTLSKDKERFGVSYGGFESDWLDDLVTGDK